jgi:pimeloyl-ACP methyl ester carboxylesterase
VPKSYGEITVRQSVRRVTHCRAGKNDGVQVPGGDVTLEADVEIPPASVGVVLFAHGSGSGRHSPRNRYVAARLQEAGLGTVLADLLTIDEERVDAETGALRFDISLLAARVVALTDWVVDYEPARSLPVGLFGASTGAAAALVAAAARPRNVAAVVSRGGRVDLAAAWATAVEAPTLLIVGDRDPVVLELNRRTLPKFRGEARLDVIPGASHLFEEPGALETVATAARDWFVRHLQRAAGEHRHS